MRKYKSGFTTDSEPIVLRRPHEMLGITASTLDGRMRKFHSNSSRFELELLKLLFFWNQRDYDMPEEKIQEMWDDSPWGDLEKSQEANNGQETK